MRKWGIIGLFAALLCGETLYAQLYQDKEKNHIGMKVGTAFTLLGGEELLNPVPKFSFQGGVFVRQQLHPSLHLQLEGLASFRGSRFNNGVERYQRISLFYLDFPVYLYTDISKRKNEHLLFFGPQTSFLLNSEVYVDTEAKARYRDLALKPYDIMAVAGYQHNGYYTGFQAAVKVGCFDINNGLKFEDVLPETGTGKTIRNLALEFSFLF